MTATTPAIGMIVPSSNRIVERCARALLPEGMEGLIARVPYAGHPEDGYLSAPFEAAAALLADARPLALCWNATRGALLGFEPDRRLCGRLSDQTGLPCTSTALATLELLRGAGLKRIAMIVQGGEAEAARLVAAFAAEGIEIVATARLGITANLDAAAVPPADLDARLQQIEAGADAGLIWSTNLAGWSLAGRHSGPLRLDSAQIGLAAACALAGHPLPG